ncbi:FGGY family carbohydrate kinase [Flavobacterium sp. FZUC8N2.13]|uniref:FGGY family carbohydrate kinase n=1 Tax=Flavobacterium zubiriense TaxID=3138075 RepID=A0ABV4TB60_9FLAO
MNAVAIFDIGKTNKKAFLFNESYQIVWENSVNLEETVDEDGFPCEDIVALKDWFLSCWEQMKSQTQFNLKAVNFSTYGASFVYIDEDGNPLTPLYNYLRPYPEKLKNKFYTKYQGEEVFAVKTASPVLGSLNSGMQIYRLKKENPEVFDKVKYCLHLPQYMSFLLTKEGFTDITSIGCHTNLWNFNKMKYHKWIRKQNITEKLAPIHSSEDAVIIENDIAVGIGLHDSSSALIPYIINFEDPFVLLSTGTWVITMNPFNDKKLNFEELQNDCLCFLQYKGKPVKASRLFAGNEHEIQSLKLAKHFDVAVDSYKQVLYDKAIITELRAKFQQHTKGDHKILKDCPFNKRDLSNFENYDEAYHQLMLDLIAQQIVSTNLVIHNSPVKKVFVDGGFSKNSIYMNLLAEAFPTMEVYAASMAQASSLGAALAIHKNWNTKPIQNDLIDLKFYKH